MKYEEVSLAYVLYGGLVVVAVWYVGMIILFSLGKI